MHSSYAGGSRAREPTWGAGVWGVLERYGVGEQRCGDDGVTAASAGAVPFGGEACGSSVQAAGPAWLAPPTVCALGPTVNGRVGITECRCVLFLKTVAHDVHPPCQSMDSSRAFMKGCGRPRTLTRSVTSRL
eukprot:COSAG01_NODE_134_length_24525_cov_434.185172_3_plen_132_part_00